MTRNITATQFATAAIALGLEPSVAYALPYGGWTRPMPWDRVMASCTSAVRWEEYLDVEDALADALHTGVVLAQDAEGRIVGAWSPVGYVLGSRSLGRTEQAYERVHAG